MNHDTQCPTCPKTCPKPCHKPNFQQPQMVTEAVRTAHLTLSNVTPKDIAAAENEYFVAFGWQEAEPRATEGPQADPCAR